MENTQSFYTYLHCRPDGSPFYVGKGTGKRSHRFSVRETHHKNIVAKHGRENIQIFVFPCETEAQAHADEVQQIAQLRRDGYDLCNRTDGGEGASGAVRSDEFKAKISAAQKAKMADPVHRERVRKLNTGKKRSVEARAKMSLAMTGKKLSAETRAKKSRALIGKKLSPEHCANISAAQMGKKRKPFSDEHRANISASAKARYARNK